MTRMLARVGLVALVVVLARCDTVEPIEAEQLVVEGFLDAGKPMPPVVLRQTRPLADPYPLDAATAVTDAHVLLQVGDQPVVYAPVPGRPGRYEPPGDAPVVPPRARYALTVRWRDQEARAGGLVPPPIGIDSIDVRVPDDPVQAVLIDSIGAAARQGFIYPIEVTVWWTTPFEEVGADSAYWVRAQLKPVTSFSSTVVDLFLRTEQIVRERTLRRDERGRHAWTGVYAVPVASAAAPPPEHSLRVLLLRGYEDYARFASSRDAPERREPVSNVDGALGVFAGVALDSLRVRVVP